MYDREITSYTTGNVKSLFFWLLGSDGNGSRLRIVGMAGFTGVYIYLIGFRIYVNCQ